MSLTLTTLNSIISDYTSDFSWVPLERPLTIDAYKNWIDENFYGEMQYLKDHTPLKENPQTIMSSAKSAIVIIKNYLPHPHPAAQPHPLEKLRTALYAKGDDYHHWFKNDLLKICEQLRVAFPNEDFLHFSDSSPVLERDLAAKAGLGWIGKNTCLIHPKKGSLFFIGEIYTSLTCEFKTQLVHDFCGTCTRCLDACPTKALIEPRKLDATKCISYWTIESKKNPPQEIRENMQDWFFGCDICQTVCPWNQKAFKTEPHFQTKSESRDDILQSLKWLFNASNKEIEREFKTSPLGRPRGNGLKRNGLIIVANLKLKELTRDVEKLTSNEKLKDLALWTLEKLR